MFHLARQRFLAGFAALLVGVTAFASQAAAIALIRDAETEALMRTYAEPIFAAAGLNPKAVKIYLVNEDSINAFVAGGQNVFINTGLIKRAETPNQVIGVIAHETGHISGGHLSRTQEAAANAAAPIIVSTLLGLAAVVAGAPDAGIAVMQGGQQIGQRTFLQYSRTQEASADQAAATYLEATGQSGKGLVEFFEMLSGQEILSAQRQDPYVRSHPLSIDRVSALTNRVEASPYYEASDPAKLQLAHDLVVAKLQGFLDRPQATLRRYKEDDPGLVARYARAVAYYRMPDLEKAIALIDGLIADQPQNPYFYELKGQVLFESGYVNESLEWHQKSVELAPEEPLLRVNLAQAMLATENPAVTQTAIDHLKNSIKRDPQNSFAYFQLAIAYAQQGKPGLADLATAERYFVIGKMPEAQAHATRAQKTLPSGSPEWLRAEDIKQAAKREKT